MSVQYKFKCKLDDLDVANTALAQFEPTDNPVLPRMAMWVEDPEEAGKPLQTDYVEVQFGVSLGRSVLIDRWDNGANKLDHDGSPLVKKSDSFEGSQDDFEAALQLVTFSRVE